MGIFDKLNGPVFLKESSDAAHQLEQLNRLHQNAAGSLKKQIELDMKLLSYGISGEETVAFELKNSFMPSKELATKLFGLTLKTAATTR